MKTPPQAPWQWQAQTHPSRGLVAASIHRAGSALSFEQVFRAWEQDSAFREFWNRGLRRLPFEAWRWECPPLRREDLAQPFDCVFVEDRELARLQPDRKAFAAHFTHPSARGFAVFDNLSRDALLLAPCPQAESSAYTHLASFLRHAPPTQVEGLWVELARLLATRLGAAPLWLNTSGLGVAWLHLRLDAQPKYYRHQPYTAARFWS